MGWSLVFWFAVVWMMVGSRARAERDERRSLAQLYDLIPVRIRQTWCRGAMGDRKNFKAGAIHLAIISDGLRLNTRIIDLATGREVGNAIGVDYRVSDRDDANYAIVTLANVPALIATPDGFGQKEDPFFDSPDDPYQNGRQ